MIRLASTLAFIANIANIANIAACSSPGMDTTGDAMQPHVDAAPAPDAPVCTPLATCAWLDGYLRHVVGSLAGERDVKPGVKLAHRASIGERDVARQFLLDELTALGYAPTRQDYNLAGNLGSNVLATLDATATAPGGLIVIGAHFDGVPDGPAAADDGTGVAMVLAAARYLRTVSTREHPIVFALFDQEELGLIGSQAYAATLTPAGVTHVHIFDMISWDADGDHAVELWSPGTSLIALYQQIGTTAGMPVTAVSFDSSDHKSFLDRGLSTTGVSEEFVGGDFTPHYHKATDTYENVSFDYLGRVAHLTFAVLEADVRTP